LWSLERTFLKGASVIPGFRVNSMVISETSPLLLRSSERSLPLLRAKDPVLPVPAQDDQEPVETGAKTRYFFRREDRISGSYSFFEAFNEVHEHPFWGVEMIEAAPSPQTVAKAYFNAENSVKSPSLFLNFLG
jgi:hypothetical protein